jgi:hypothetical protein
MYKDGDQRVHIKRIASDYPGDLVWFISTHHMPYTCLSFATGLPCHHAGEGILKDHTLVQQETIG